jgi:hypothetical protein
MPLTHDEFEQSFTKIIRDLFDEDGKARAAGAYDLVYAAPGTYVNPAGTSGVAARVLIYIWSHFTRGEESAIATQRLLEHVGMADKLPERWLEVYRTREGLHGV